MALKDLDRTVRLLDEVGNFINIGNPLYVYDVGGGGPGGGGASMIDKSAFIEGTTRFNPIGGVFNEVLGADPTEDTAATARITAKRALHVNLRSDAGVELGTLTNPFQVNPTAGMSAIIDTGNSTTTPLGISGTYTGTWIEVTGYAALSVNVIAGQSSAINGAEMQFSSNGVDIDNRDIFSLGGGSGRVFFSPIRARYFRFVLLNGTITQGFLRVQTLLHFHPALPISDALTFDLKAANNFTAIPVTSYAHVFNGATWDRVRGNQNAITLFSSLSRTAAATSSAQNNYTGGGTVLFLNVTTAPASPGSGGLQMFFQTQDVGISGSWAQINPTPPTINAVGAYLFVIGAGATAPLYPTAGGRMVQAAGVPLPRVWRVVINHLDAQAYVYTAIHQYTA